MLRLAIYLFNYTTLFICIIVNIGKKKLANLLKSSPKAGGAPCFTLTASHVPLFTTAVGRFLGFRRSCDI